MTEMMIQNNTTHIKICGKTFQRYLKNIKLDQSTGCYNYTGSNDDRGYGRIRIGGGVRIKTHRLAILLDGRDLPKDMYACHTCDNPSCVNPKHLFVGTHTDNMNDMVVKGRCKSTSPYTNKTHCKQGHEFNEENTYHPHRNKNHRVCKTCRRLSYNRNIEKRRAYDRLRSQRI